MGKAKPSTQIHILEIGYMHVAVPDHATLSKLLDGLVKCQIVDKDFKGGYWKQERRLGISFEVVEASDVHLDRTEPRGDSNGHANGRAAPIDVGNVCPTSAFDPPDPPTVRAKRITNRQLLLGKE